MSNTVFSFPSLPVLVVRDSFLTFPVMVFLFMSVFVTFRVAVLMGLYYGLGLWESLWEANWKAEPRSPLKIIAKLEKKSIWKYILCGWIWKIVEIYMGGGWRGGYWGERKY